MNTPAEQLALCFSVGRYRCGPPGSEVYCSSLAYYTSRAKNEALYAQMFGGLQGRWELETIRVSWSIGGVVSDIGCPANSIMKYTVAAQH